MVMPWEIQIKIFASLDFEFEKTWENNLKTYYSIMDLHNLLVPSNHDYEEQSPSYCCTFTYEQLIVSSLMFILNVFTIMPILNIQ
jgi:hypothetical protein